MSEQAEWEIQMGRPEKAIIYLDRCLPSSLPTTHGSKTSEPWTSGLGLWCLMSANQGNQHPPGRHLHPHNACTGKLDVVEQYLECDRQTQERHLVTLLLVTTGKAGSSRLPGCNGGRQWGDCQKTLSVQFKSFDKVLVTLRYPNNPGALLVQGDALYHTGLFEHSLVSYYKVM